MDERLRTIGEFTDYDGMLAIVRRDKSCRSPASSSTTLPAYRAAICRNSFGARPVRRIAHISMGPLFSALGVRCVMIEDPAATERLRKQLKPRNGSYVRAAPRIILTERVWRQLQSAEGWRDAKIKRRTAQQNHAGGCAAAMEWGNEMKLDARRCRGFWSRCLAPDGGNPARRSPYT